MRDGPTIAAIAALLGDPARANMLVALMDGRSLTVSELAQLSGVGLPTASAHLGKLEAAGLVSTRKGGRHRYIRLADHDVAGVLEALMGLAQRTGATRLRTGPRDAALREARVCYDHLAGRQGVSLMRGLVEQGWLENEGLAGVTATGRARLAAIGIDLEALARGRRPICRRCLDWSERHDHLGGALGAAVLAYIVERRWARRAEGRVIAFSPDGARAFATAFPLAT